MDDFTIAILVPLCSLAFMYILTSVCLRLIEKEWLIWPLNKLNWYKQRPIPYTKGVPFASIPSALQVPKHRWSKRYAAVYIYRPTGVSLFGPQHDLFQDRAWTYKGLTRSWEPDPYAHYKFDATSGMWKWVGGWRDLTAGAKAGGKIDWNNVALSTQHVNHLHTTIFFPKEEWPSGSREEEILW